VVSSFVEPLLVNIIKNGTCRLSFGEVENTPGKFLIFVGVSKSIVF